MNCPKLRRDFFAVLLLIISIFPLLASAQKIDRKCGPKEYYNTRTFLQNDSLNQPPYDAIVHLNAKGWGTATFISDQVLITARHLADKKRLHQIKLYKNVFSNGSVTAVHVLLNEEDFSVINYESNCHFISNDISFIVLSASGTEQVKPIYTHAIGIADYKTLPIDTNAVVTLTGYPVDLAGDGLNATDILANKRIRFGELSFDDKCPMVGYKIFACSGDSGAPVWVSVNGQHYLIGIHHGGPERGTRFVPEKRNSAALITADVLAALHR